MSARKGAGMLELWRKIRAIFSRERLSRELEEEMLTHIELRARTLARQGTDAEEARALAGRRFGNRTAWAERARDAWSFPTLESIAQDARFGARALRRNPGFALIAILVIAVGMGATAAVFSVVDRILFRSLQYQDAEHLVAIGILHPLMDGEFLIANDYLYLREQTAAGRTPLAAVTSWTGVADCDLTELKPQRLACAQVEWSFLRTFGIRPAEGRDFTREEDVQYAPAVALISYAFWQARFGAQRSAVGQMIVVDGAPVRVIGVLPRDFELPSLERADLLVPQALHMLQYTPGDTGRPLHVFGRLKPGVGEQRARAELQPFFRFAMEFMTPKQRQQASVALHSVRDFQVHDVRLASWVLFGTTLAILLIVCANVANLLLARSEARRREFAMRLALGAGRTRLMRQVITESLLLCCCGAAGGCALAWAIVAAFRALAPRSIPRIAEASLDTRALVFTMAATLACAMALGLSTALFGLRTGDLAGWRATGGPRHSVRRTLAAAQIAVSLVLLSDAGLLIESLRRMTETAPGINTEQVVTAGITVGPPRYANGSLRQQYFDSLVTRLRANPLVTAAAISDTVPPAGFMHNHPFSGLHVAGRAPGEPGLGGVVWRRTVSPGYFEAVGTPILRGRAFRQEDLASRQNMMVLSATLARRLFGAEDPVGKMIGIPLRGSPNAVVLGVAADVENAGVPGRSEPEYYLLRRPVPANASVAANPPAPPKGNDALLGGEASLIARALHAYDGEAYVIVRSPARTGAVAGWIRTEAAALDPTVPVTIAAMRERVRELSARPRFNAFLLGLFATVGMLLAAFGLYGLIGFLVAQRTQEIGVRMAMGATPATVAALVVRDGLRWTVAGAAAGIAGAAVTARALRGILFGVQPENPAIFGAAALVLMTAAVLAMLVPSLRAARIDPVVALRAD